MPTPTPEDPDDFKPITDKATDDTEIPPNPKCKQKHVKEQAWLLEVKLWEALFKVIPDKEKVNLKVPIGGDQGWLTLVARPVITKDFKSEPNKDAGKPNAGKNCVGMLTFGGAYLLWRHCTHHSHNPKGGGPDTGTYNAFEVYQIRGELVEKAKIS